MTDKEKKKKENRLKTVQKSYENLSPSIGFTGDPISDVHKMVEYGQEIQSQICKLADSIKIDDYEEANKITPISKGLYMEFVNVAVKRMMGKLNEKVSEKLDKEFGTKLLDLNMLNTFLNTYVADQDLKLADSDDDKFEPFNEHESEEFQNLLEKSARTRISINENLYPQLKELGNAAEYITNGEITYKEFKMLNDFEYYQNGGYPSPTSPSRSWSIYNNFANAHRLMDKYKFDQAKELSKEFGLDITVGPKNPVMHPWMLAE